ncbi:MAG TPA: recombination-associated protein RdgC [Solimonas sp.]
MFFRNLIAFNLPAGWAMTPAALEEALSAQPLTPCAGQNLQSRGWVPPTASGQLVRSVEKQYVIALGTEQKLLPGKVVKQHAAERAAQVEQVKGYKPGGKMMREIKDQVILELLPRAFVQRGSLRAWLDTQHGFLCVDTASPAKAEELVEMLRNTLNGELAVTLPEPAQSPSSLMTGWLAAGAAPGRFALGESCRLIGTDASKPTVAYTRHGLVGEDVRRHITEGKFATEVALVWNEAISFILTDKLHLKRLAFLTVREEQSDHPEEQIDVDLTLMAGELALLLADLHQVIGAKRPEAHERARCDVLMTAEDLGATT